VLGWTEFGQSMVFLFYPFLRGKNNCNLLSFPVEAGGVREGEGEENVDSGRKATGYTADGKDAANLHTQLGCPYRRRPVVPGTGVVYPGRRTLGCLVESGQFLRF